MPHRLNSCHIDHHHRSLDLAVVGSSCSPHRIGRQKDACSEVEVEDSVGILLLYRGGAEGSNSTSVSGPLALVLRVCVGVVD